MLRNELAVAIANMTEVIHEKLDWGNDAKFAWVVCHDYVSVEELARLYIDTLLEEYDAQYLLRLFEENGVSEYDNEYLKGIVLSIDNQLLLWATFYHSLGMNVTCIHGDKQHQYTFKHPSDPKWEMYTQEAQPIQYILKQDWNVATGIGLVLGYNGYRAIDIDEFDFSERKFNLDNKFFIKECLSVLKLPMNYAWVVKSGSGCGIHIIFKSKDIPNFHCKSQAFGTDDQRNIRDYHVHHFELRWMDHLVLSPSKHISGNNYSYINGIPLSEPECVEIDSINDLINKFSLRKCSASYNVGSDMSKQGKCIYYKREEIVLDSFGKFGYDIEENINWLKECSSSEALMQLGYCFLLGKGGAFQDNNQAFYYFKKANIPESYYNLCYMVALGLKKVAFAEFQRYLACCGDTMSEEEQKHILLLSSKYMKQEDVSIVSDAQKSTNKKTLLFFDTETTGLPKDHDAPSSHTSNWPRLVQLSWIVTTPNGEILRSINRIIRPEGFSIPLMASSLHGINTQKAKIEGLSLSVVINEFLLDVRNASKIIGHNVDFDKKIVGAEMIRLGLDDIMDKTKSVCTMKSTKYYCRLPSGRRIGGYKFPTLQELYQKLFGDNFSNAHDASNDVNATLKCYFELLKRGLI